MKRWLLIKLCTLGEHCLNAFVWVMVLTASMLGVVFDQLEQDDNPTPEDTEQ